MMPIINSRLEKIGMERFSEIFLEAMKDEEHILTPEKFALAQAAEVTQEFYQAYRKERKEMYLRLYKQFLPKFATKPVAHVLDSLNNWDIPKKEIMEKLWNEPQK